MIRAFCLFRLIAGAVMLAAGLQGTLSIPAAAAQVSEIAIAVDAAEARATIELATFPEPFVPLNGEYRVEVHSAQPTLIDNVEVDSGARVVVPWGQSLRTGSARDRSTVLDPMTFDRLVAEAARPSRRSTLRLLPAGLLGGALAASEYGPRLPSQTPG